MPIQTDDEAISYIEDFYLNSSNINKFGLENRSSGLHIKESVKSVINATDKHDLLESLQNLDSINAYRILSGIKYLGYRTTSPSVYPRPSITAANFVHMSVNDDGCIVFKEEAFTFTDPINNSMQSSQLQIAIKNAFKDKITSLREKMIDINHTPALMASPGYKSLAWNKPCYLFFMMDEKEWKILKNRGEADCIHIATYKGGQNRNLTFFNGGFFEIEVEVDGNKQTRQVAYCENHHMSADGKRYREDNAEDAANYKFDLVYRVGTKGLTNSDRETIIIDPTGTNFGPP